MIKCILFDNNGVLTTSDKERTYPVMSRYLGISERKVKQLFDPFVRDLDIGEISQKEFYRKILQQGKLARPVDEFAHAHLHAYRPKKDNQRIARALRKHYRVAMLSNFGEAFWSQYNHWGLDRIFEKKNVFMSADLGMAKPDSKIFKYTLKKLKLDADEVLFIDDKPENIRAARALGIHTILCTSHTKLVASLKKRKIRFK